MVIEIETDRQTKYEESCKSFMNKLKQNICVGANSKKCNGGKMVGWKPARERARRESYRKGERERVFVRHAASAFLSN